MGLHPCPVTDLEHVGHHLDARIAVRNDRSTPHAITADGIRVRYGSEIDIPIAWEDMHSTTRRKHVNNGKQPKVTSDENGEASLNMRIQNETNIEIRLNRPVSIRLPHGTETVSTVNLYADDPEGFTDEVRHRR